MKKKLLCLLCAAALTLGLAAPALANSGPIYETGSPTGALAPLTGTGVSVLHEDLTLDFSAQDPQDFRTQGRAEAAYQMQAQAPGTVEMAFPVAAFLTGQGLPAVTVDGAEVPVQVLDAGPLGYGREDEALPAFSQLLAQTSKGEYTPAHYQMDDVGTLVEFTVYCREAQDDTGWFARAVLPDDGVTRSVADEAKGIGWESGVGVEYTFDFGKPGWVYILGDAEALAFGAQYEGKPQDPPGKMPYDREDTPMTVRDFLTWYAARWQAGQEEGTLAQRLAPGQAARLLAQRLDAVCAGEDGGHAVGLTDGLYRRRALLLCFSVDFADTGLRTVRVETPIAPARDREGTKEYRQQAQYFFGPAQGWDAFGDISLTLILPEQAPYLLESSVPLRQAQGKARTYTAQLDGLPEEDFSAVFCEVETPAEDNGARLVRVLPILLVILVAVPLAALVFAGVWVVKLMGKFKEDPPPEEGEQERPPDGE